MEEMRRCKDLKQAIHMVNENVKMIKSEPETQPETFLTETRKIDSKISPWTKEQQENI